MSGILIALIILLANATFAEAPNSTTIPDQTWNGEFPWTLDLSTNNYFSDPEGGPLTYTSPIRVDNKSDISFTLSGSIITFTFVDEDFDGSNQFTFSVTDNESLSITSNTVTFSGEAESGSTVFLFDGGVAIGTTTATSPWSLTVNLADGTHIITATSTDAAGTTSSEFGPITITIDTTPTDTTAPVITLNGANPQTVKRGDSYVELGATASDDVDGDITASIVIDASAVNTKKVGSYPVTYDVTDSSGNAASQVIRIVDVVK